jgi:hypothetical protein
MMLLRIMRSCLSVALEFRLLYNSFIMNMLMKSSADEEAV